MVLNIGDVQVTRGCARRRVRAITGRVDPLSARWIRRRHGHHQPSDRDLPLNGRDYLQLASLSSGTLPTSGVGISIGGQAGSQVAFLLDGQDNNNQQISTGHSGQKEVVKPSVDAIQEFKVFTNGYAAEYGRSSSGVVSVSLKSGTNSLQGTSTSIRHEVRRQELLRHGEAALPAQSTGRRLSPGPQPHLLLRDVERGVCAAAPRWRPCRR